MSIALMGTNIWLPRAKITTARGINMLTRSKIITGKIAQRVIVMGTVFLTSAFF